MTLEIVMMWAAVSGYAASAALFTTGFVFRSKLISAAAPWVALAGLLPHAVAIAERWIRIGHGPYLGFYEVVSSYAFISVAALVGFGFWRRELSAIGLVLMPLSFLMLGAAMFTPKAELEITGKLASWWLNIHVVFAKLSYGAFIVAFALALVFLFRERARGTLSEMLEKLPSQDTIDDLQFRFVGIGFVFLGIMIASGAIWANEAWGRYWAWDPIETWSLISWVVYAMYLHTRLTLGWRGGRSAWFACLALPVVVFSLIGVPLVYQSIHGAYLTGY
ncbi:MAG: c-type cytochrome biogenesis protein CcsB [Coriobacteriia bacterium]|nr:c-type cytochrome biogenesis protein CcsB [Coriobacteriia bacterium]